jgi:hypothetical protein
MKVKELLERYGLKTRQTLYDRLKALDINLAKDEKGHNYATPEQLEQLDQLDQHLQTPGATLASFTPITRTEIAPADTLPDSLPAIPEDTALDTQVDGRLLVLAQAIASQMNPRSPLWYMDELKRAAEEGWLLTTAEVRELIGVKPTAAQGEDTYQRGCWLFTKAGKIGNQTAWRVSKQGENELKIKK